MSIKNSSFDNKYVPNFKVKHRKAEKLILSRRFGDLYERAGDRFCMYPGEWAYMRTNF